MEFCLKHPQGTYNRLANSKGSGETALISPEPLLDAYVIITLFSRASLFVQQMGCGI